MTRKSCTSNKIVFKLLWVRTPRCIMTRPFITGVYIWSKYSKIYTVFSLCGLFLIFYTQRNVLWQTCQCHILERISTTPLLLLNKGFLKFCNDVNPILWKVLTAYVHKECINDHNWPSRSNGFHTQFGS